MNRILILGAVVAVGLLTSGCASTRITTDGVLSDTTTTTKTTPAGTTSTETKRVLTPAMAEFLLKSGKIQNEGQRVGLWDCLRYGACPYADSYAGYYPTGGVGYDRAGVNIHTGSGNVVYDPYRGR